MSKAKKTSRRRRQAPPPQKRSPWLARGLAGLGAVALVVVVAALWRSSVDERAGPAPAADPGPVHVHGLGIHPADNTLFIATHTGLYRSAEGESTSVRVSDSRQDTMGFAIVDADRFLGSGHPDLREDLPPLLGLIESTDEGRTWDSISLLGEADFHVLRTAGERVYGYDSSGDRLMVSKDAGRSWTQVDRPAPLVDLAVDPTDADHLVAAGASDLARGLYESRDGGRSWERIGNSIGLLAWPARDRLYLLDGSGAVFLSTDGGDGFERRGSPRGQPAAFLGQSADELYAALHDGTVLRSTDGGGRWEVRSAP
jgi:hypothetical protein